MGHFSKGFLRSFPITCDSAVEIPSESGEELVSVLLSLGKAHAH